MCFKKKLFEVNVMERYIHLWKRMCTLSDKRLVCPRSTQTFGCLKHRAEHTVVIIPKKIKR